MSRSRHLAAAACALGLVLFGCSGRERGDAVVDVQDPLGDIAVVREDEVTSYDDVPVEGFDRLSEAGRLRVVHRANRSACDCGCYGHSINACLHQKEECAVAARLASGFVADVLAAELAAARLTPLSEAENGAADGSEGSSRTVPQGSASPAGTTDGVPAPAGNGRERPLSDFAPMVVNPPADFGSVPPLDEAAAGATAPAGTTLVAPAVPTGAVVAVPTLPGGTPSGGVVGPGGGQGALPPAPGGVPSGGVIGPGVATGPTRP